MKQGQDLYQVSADRWTPAEDIANIAAAAESPAQTAGGRKWESSIKKYLSGNIYPMVSVTKDKNGGLRDMSTHFVGVLPDGQTYRDTMTQERSVQAEQKDPLLEPAGERLTFGGITTQGGELYAHYTPENYEASGKDLKISGTAQSPVAVFLPTASGFDSRLPQDGEVEGLSWLYQSPAEIKLNIEEKAAFKELFSGYGIEYGKEVAYKLKPGDKAILDAAAKSDKDGSISLTGLYGYLKAPGDIFAMHKDGIWGGKGTWYNLLYQGESLTSEQKNEIYLSNASVDGKGEDWGISWQTESPYGKSSLKVKVNEDEAKEFTKKNGLEIKNNVLAVGYDLTKDTDFKLSALADKKTDNKGEASVRSQEWSRQIETAVAEGLPASDLEKEINKKDKEDGKLKFLVTGRLDIAFDMFT